MFLLSRPSLHLPDPHLPAPSLPKRHLSSQRREDIDAAHAATPHGAADMIVCSSDRQDVQPIDR